MRSECREWVVLCLALAGAGTANQAESYEPSDVQRMPPITVTGENEPAQDWLLSTTCVAPTPAASARVQDSAALLAEQPGVAVVRNGPQTGLIQLRGLQGDRVKLSLDGRTISPACPNHMDPPMHYVAAGEISQLAVMAGMTPVSLGGDSIGGTVLVLPAPPRFSTNDQTAAWGDLAGGFYSHNDGWSAEAGGGVADRGLSAAYQGSWQRADDYRFPGGRVRDTGFDTMHHRWLLGMGVGPGVLSADVGLLRTRDAGTPALPMDMIEDDGYSGGLRYRGDYAWGSLTSRFYRHEIDHLMDNYSLRPAGPMRMFSPAESDDTGFSTDVTLRGSAHEFRIGGDLHRNDFSAYQQNVATGAQQDTLNDAVRNRLGVYGEWRGDLSERWHPLLGVRVDTILADADPIERAYPASAADRDAFNAQGHDRTEANIDATAALRYTPNPASAYELGLARKSRSPSSLERYLWTPLSASAGQADGRTYLGNLDLDPEVSHQVGFTADWHGPRWQFKVSPFYNAVSDYIQGVPIARVDANGRPVLQFQNLERADLYGVEAWTHYDFVPGLRALGSLSYVRGENRDDDDSLYRIAPLRGVVALEGRKGRFDGRVEVVLVARQDEVAAYNQEPPTPGYTLLNLQAGVQLPHRVSLRAGIENLLDEHYTDHLGGINRVSGSDVAVGLRIPGPARWVYVSMRWEF